MRMSLPEVGVRSRQALSQLGERVWAPRARPRWLPAGAAAPPVRGLDDVDGVVQCLRRQDPETLDRSVEAADRVLRGEVPILGLGWVEVGEDPAWDIDPVTRCRAPRRHWSRIAYLDPKEVGDSKFVWELNRHQFLIWIAQAYRITGKPEYARRAWDLVHSWIRANPPGVGVNWASSLEVAFRAIAWCWVWHLAAPDRFLGSRERRTILGILALHGRHIASYLSTYFSRNTHLTGEALGLCYLAAAWPTSRRSAAWWRRGHAVLLRELEWQVLPDGMQFERSSCYHRYTLDFYLHFALLIQQWQRIVPAALLRRIREMALVLRGLRGPDGLLVNLGDDDGGECLPLGQLDPRDPSLTLAVASILLDEPVLWPGTSGSGAVVWLTGEAAFLGAVNSAGSGAKPSHHIVLASAGIVMCQEAGDFVVASTGSRDPAGRRPAHSHDDAFSVELWCGGRPVLIDPGTFTYTGDQVQRSWYRSAAAHNSLMIDGWPSSPSSGPFGWRDLSTGALRSCISSKAAVMIEMARSFRGMEDVGPHCRRILGWFGVGWVLWDRVLGHGLHDVAVRFQLPPGQRPALLFAGKLVEDGSVSLAHSPVSPRYGQLVPSEAFSISGRVNLPADLVTVIVPQGPGRTSLTQTSVCTLDPQLERPCAERRVVVRDTHGGIVHEIELRAALSPAGASEDETEDATTSWTRTSLSGGPSVRLVANPPAGEIRVVHV